MSQHTIIQPTVRWVFGWDHPLQTFFLQKHTREFEGTDENPVFWLGTRPGEIYEVEDLVTVARMNGLDISTTDQVKLYGEKDDGV